MIQLTAKFEATNETIDVVDRILEALLPIQSCDKSMDMYIAAHELIINSIAAMNKTDKTEDGNIEVFIALDRRNIEIKVTDFAGGADKIHEKLEGNILDNLLSESGRGLFMVNSLVDDLSVTVEENSRTTCTIKKIITKEK